MQSGMDTEHYHEREFNYCWSGIVDRTPLIGKY